MKKSTIKKLHLLADNCIRLQEKERPELAWLKEKHRQIQNSYHLANKTQTDRFLYERMYGHSPTKASDTLKLRYWRTGNTLPATGSSVCSLVRPLSFQNRRSCICFNNIMTEAR